MKITDHKHHCECCNKEHEDHDNNDPNDNCFIRPCYEIICNTCWNNGYRYPEQSELMIQLANLGGTITDSDGNDITPKLN